MIKTGYLIPVDADDKVATWIDLEGWLRDVSLLSAKHILVVLDACHSGIALDPVVQWRDLGTSQGEPLAALRTRRSRRIITSALDDQVALDSGPVSGHSLFTGCLIEGLTHGVRRGGIRATTGSELALYLRQRVVTYPESRQTPVSGTFAFDDHGEMVIPLVSERVNDGREASTASASWLDLIDLGDDAQAALEAMSGPSAARPSGEVESDREHASASADVAKADGEAMPATAKLLVQPPVESHGEIEVVSEPVPPAEQVPRRGDGDPRRAWIVVGAAGAMLAVALIAYRIVPEQGPRRDRTVAASPEDAVEGPPDARVVRDGPQQGSRVALPVDASLEGAVESPSDARVVRDGAQQRSRLEGPVAVLPKDAAPSPLDAQMVPDGAQPAPPAEGCPAGMRTVPTGTLRMGSPDGVGDADERPQHAVTLSAYCIDTTEVTVKAYAACVAAKGCTAAPLTVKWSGYSADDVKLYSQFCNGDDRPDHPINCVDWDQATAYCRWPASGCRPRPSGSTLRAGPMAVSIRGGTSSLARHA